VIIQKPLKPTLLTDQVYAVLHEAIISGELPAGSRLRIRDLAAQVGTSVMPVREAIRRLEEAGLATREPHKGAVVKGLTLEELVHVYGVRRLLEGEAARLGAERITADDCERMQAEYDAMMTAIRRHRVVEFLDHDEALLTILYTASGNPVLVNLIKTLWTHCRAYKLVGAQGPVSGEGADWLWCYQTDLVAAAREHDGAAALSVSDASLDNATERIRALLAAQKDGDGAL
jgi:DNA-binding GntR family transcriptional regulator